MTNVVQMKSAQLSSQWTEQAAEAIQSSNVAGMKAVLEDALKHNAQLATVLDGMAGLYANKADLPRSFSQESESAIAAMRDVALAAVELSKAALQTRV